MRVMTTKSKNAESFYITKSFKNNAGKSTSKIVRKLGTLRELSEMLGTDRDGVMAWAREQARIETEKYKEAVVRSSSLFKLHFMQTDIWITTTKSCMRAAICSCSLSTTSFVWTRCAEKSGINIPLNMI